jgi:hypothetical protein
LGTFDSGTSNKNQQSFLIFDLVFVEELTLKTPADEMTVKIKNIVSRIVNNSQFNFFLKFGFDIHGEVVFTN